MSGFAVVVVAEDDDDLRELLVGALASPELRVVELEDGGELRDYVAFLERHGAPPRLPDVIVTDLRMPGASGLDVIAWARTLGVRCPVIVLTAFPDASVHARAAGLGGVTVLEKPIELAALRLAVGQVLAA
jgi:CheY-like chemotaxis protein